LVSQLVPRAKHSVNSVLHTSPIARRKKQAIACFLTTEAKTPGGETPRGMPDEPAPTLMTKSDKCKRYDVRLPTRTVEPISELYNCYSGRVGRC
jgi:hypothetical protein